MVFDITDRVAALREYYDALLNRRLDEIAALAEVPREQLISINPVDFIEKNINQQIKGHTYRKIAPWIAEHKNDNTFLISPLDAVEETAAQISYKSNVKICRTIRASKCDVMPCPKDLALDFFIRNHRQSAPIITRSAVCFALVYHSEIVAVMLYGVSNGAVRGQKTDYELVRLAISKGTRVHGGASKLQQACEDTLREMGVATIYSYSNATINNGAVYEKLGFDGSKIDEGQPFAILQDNSIVRLVNLYPDSNDVALAARGRIKTHLGGNRVWEKEL